jgi:hypothetical protein
MTKAHNKTFQPTGDTAGRFSFYGVARRLKDVVVRNKH